MGRRALRFRSLLAAVLIWSLIVPARAADAPLRSYSVFLDGVQVRSIEGFWDGAHIMLSLEQLAHILRLPMTREAGSRALKVNVDRYVLAPGDADVTLNGESFMQASALPVDRNKMLFVAMPDLQTILAQNMTLLGTRLDIASVQAPESVHTTPLDHPRVSTYTVRGDSGNSPSSGGAAPPPKRFSSNSTNALIVHAESTDFGGFRSRNLSLTTDGTRMRGDIDVSAFGNASPSLTGQVSIGTHDRYVQVGYEGNPLNGLVFAAPGGSGFNVVRASLAYGSEHDSLGRTILAVRRERAHGATIFGVIRSQGSTIPIVGSRTSSDGIVKFTREVWLTSSGIVGSVSLATQGRFFGEVVASETLGNVPLQIGEAPQRVNVGYRATDHTTVRAGLTSGYRQKAAPYFAISMTGAGGLSGSLQFAGSNRNANLSYSNARASVAGSFSTAPDGSTFGISGSYQQRHRLWEFSAYQSSGSGDETIRTHTTTGAGLIFGIERITAPGRTRIGPIIGINVPVGRTTAFDLTEHPTGGGRTIGFGLTQRFDFSAKPRLRSITLLNSASSELYVDDHLVRRIDGNVTTVSISPGNHHVQARSADGSLASIPSDVSDTTRDVDVALLPMRPIAGRVVQSDADPAGRKISLEHIQIRLMPGNVLAETEADGTFVFPSTPTARNARVEIVPDSLADDLKVGDDAPADAAPLILSVTTRVKVHRKKF